MVRGPWVGRHDFTLHYITLEWRTLWLNLYFVVHAHNSWSLTKPLTKTWALSLKTCCGGIPCPTGPQHNHRHLFWVTLLVRRPWRGANPTSPVLLGGPWCTVLWFAGPAAFLLLNHPCLNRLLLLIPTSGAHVYSPTSLSNASGHEDCASAG